MAIPVKWSGESALGLCQALSVGVSCDNNILRWLRLNVDENPVTFKLPRQISISRYVFENSTNSCVCTFKAFGNIFIAYLFKRLRRQFINLFI